ncbi:putative glycosyl hydrolase [Bacillus phage PK16]|nr:putative glycosyl hydrolase [Bacillus phage PK16]
MLQVKSFSGATHAEQIQNAINAASVSTTDKTVQLEEFKDYYITAPIIVKKNVELLFGYGTKLVVGGNVRVLELELNASVTNPYIAIDDPTFDSAVFYLDGKNKFYNTWNRTSIKNGVIVNWSGSHKGVGISCFSGGTGHEVSFVNFFDIKMVGLRRGIELKATKPTTGMSWVNANRFKDISFDDCVEMIVIESSETIPNECSGNMFTGLQIQPSAATQLIFKVNGQQNRFEGMLWDTHLITNTGAFVQFTNTSSYNKIDFNGSVPTAKVSDAGAFNKVL